MTDYTPAQLHASKPGALESSRQASHPHGRDAATEVLAAKATTMGSSATAAAAAVSLLQNDPVKSTADILCLSGQAMDRAAASAAPAVSAGGNLLACVHAVARGDTYATATSARSVLNQVAPTLTKTPIGLMADVFVLGLGSAKLADVTDKMTQTASTLQSEQPRKKRIQALVELVAISQALVHLLRLVAIVSLATMRRTLAWITRVPALAPTAGKLLQGIEYVAASPLGRVLAKAGRWIPLINVAGVAISSGALYEVWHDRRSSRQTKWFAVLDVMAAVGAFVAGLTLGGGALLTALLVSVGADLALSKARQQDTRRNSHQGLLGTKG